MSKDNPYQPPDTIGALGPTMLSASQRLTLWTGSVGAFLVFWLIFGVGLSMMVYLMAHVFAIESAALMVGTASLGAGISYAITRRYHLEALLDFHRQNEHDLRPGESLGE